MLHIFRNLSFRQRSPLVAVMLPACLVIGIAGCGTGPVGNVEGHVTLNGNPAPDGTIVMFTEGPEPFSGVVGGDGKFKMEKPVLVGSYKVAVQQIEKDDMAPEERKRLAAAGKSLAFVSAIPEKYQRPDSSGVTFDVKEGSNSFELDMIPQRGGAAPTGGGGSKGKGG